MGDSAPAEASPAALSVVLTTVPDMTAAEALTTELVREGLIACGNIVPGVVSIYRWEGEVTREGEVLVLMKTSQSRVEQLLSRVPELHSYAVPEVVELPIGSVSGPYGRWIMESTRGPVNESQAER